MKLKFILISLLFCSLLINGQEKKKIQVKFQISYEGYRKHYPKDIRIIENECTEKITEQYNQSILFACFLNENCDHQIMIELTSLGSGSLDETGFKTYLIKDSTKLSQKPVYYTFRSPLENMDTIPVNPTIFISEIVEKYNQFLEIQKSIVIKNLLSKVSLANDFYIIGGEKSFIIPISHINHSINKRSKFLIVTEGKHPVFGISSSFDTTLVSEFIANLDSAIEYYNIPESYPEGCLYAHFLSGDQKYFNNADKINHDSTVGKKVFLTEYIPFIDDKITTSNPDDTLDKILNSGNDEDN